MGASMSEGGGMGGMGELVVCGAEAGNWGGGGVRVRAAWARASLVVEGLLSS